MRFSRIILIVVMGVTSVAAASKPHVIAFGKPNIVKSYSDIDEHPIELKVRAIYVDGRLKEYTVGSPHDVTDRVFVVQRAYRLNDSLPHDKTPAQQWRWEMGGWMSVDRISGRMSLLNLPDFDAYYSSASWYRDYAAYCGISENGKKVSLVVAQMGIRKPVLKKLAGEIGRDLQSNPCTPPTWERPLRVTFAVGGVNNSYSLRGRAVELVADEEEDEGD